MYHWEYYNSVLRDSTTENMILREEESVVGVTMPTYISLTATGNGEQWTVIDEVNIQHDKRDRQNNNEVIVKTHVVALRVVKGNIQRRSKIQWVKEEKQK